jgi:hypothetical protein
MSTFTIKKALCVVALSFVASILSSCTKGHVTISIPVEGIDSPFKNKERIRDRHSRMFYYSDPFRHLNGI